MEAGREMSVGVETLHDEFVPLGRKFLLTLELAAMFLAIPLLIFYRILPNAPIAFLLAVSLAAFLVLRRDPTFDTMRLLSIKSALKKFGEVLLRDVWLIAALGIAVWYLAPDLLFSLIKRTPLFWVAIMLLYPIVSVYPQELLFRAYFFHRYEPLFGSGAGMTVASALAFAFVHIVFHNWVAVVLTLVGGILFSWTYRRSGSLLLTCVDHALFGNFIFTIGLGGFFVPVGR